MGRPPGGTPVGNSRCSNVNSATGGGSATTCTSPSVARSRRRKARRPRRGNILTTPPGWRRVLRCCLSSVRTQRCDQHRSRWSGSPRGCAGLRGLRCLRSPWSRSPLRAAQMILRLRARRHPHRRPHRLQPPPPPRADPDTHVDAERHRGAGWCRTPRAGRDRRRLHPRLVGRGSVAVGHLRGRRRPAAFAGANRNRLPVPSPPTAPSPTAHSARWAKDATCKTTTPSTTLAPAAASVCPSGTTSFPDPDGEHRRPRARPVGRGLAGRPRGRRPRGLDRPRDPRRSRGRWSGRGHHRGQPPWPTRPSSARTRATTPWCCCASSVTTTRCRPSRSVALVLSEFRPRLLC